jgi:hypothetical protein
MSPRIKLKEESRYRRPGLQIVSDVLRFIVRTIAGFFDGLTYLMESRFYQVVRIAATVWIVWLLRKHAQVGPIGLGISEADLPKYLRAGMYFAVFGCIVACLWSGSLCSSLAGILSHLIDSSDDRPMEEDPMDKLNRLLGAGKTSHAKSLCKRMLRCHEGSRTTVETILATLDDRNHKKLRLNPPAKIPRGSK